MTDIPAPSNILGELDPPSAKPPDKAFPARLSLEDFPNPPSPGGHRLPLTMDNVAHLLAGNGVEVSYDVISKHLSVRHGLRKLEDSDLISLANLNGLASGQFLDFVATLGRRDGINPVADWIRLKPWDGEDRLPELYATIQVQTAYPEQVRDVLLYRWLLSAVAAALSPTGFHSRGVLTLQGPQGAGKTSWIARLVPKDKQRALFKRDHHLDPANKDSVLIAVAHWIVELGELDSSFRRDVARLKGFITNDCDRIRPPYAARAVAMERRTVFAASVNDAKFLVDTTGNSRWWTIAVEELDYEHEIDMQQVYAQLARDFDAGVQWWLTPDEERQLAVINAGHQVTSAVEERLRERIDPDSKQLVYMTAIEALRKVGIGHPSNQQCREAGAVLRSIYGTPRRVQGREQWKVALTSGEAFRPVLMDDDEIY